MRDRRDVGCEYESMPTPVIYHAPGGPSDLSGQFWITAWVSDREEGTMYFAPRYDTVRSTAEGQTLYAGYAAKMRIPPVLLPDAVAETVRCQVHCCFRSRPAASLDSPVGGFIASVSKDAGGSRSSNRARASSTFGVPGGWASPASALT